MIELAKRLRGFTLVELLVVVAILVIIASLIFAVYARSREKGRQTVCLSNLRQLGVALLSYAHDYGGCFPPYRSQPLRPLETVEGCYHATDGTHEGTIFAPQLLVQSVNPYLKSQEVWFCPSDPYQRTSTFYWCVSHQYTSYVFDLRGCRYLKDTGFRMDHPRAARSPSSYVLAYDPNFVWPSDWDFADSREAELHPKVGGNHFGGSNKLYLDGHVKWGKVGVFINHPPRR